MTVSVYAIHGMLQLLIFGVLYPTGVVIAQLRGRIGPIWRPLHIGIQLTASVLFLVSASLVGWAVKKDRVMDKASLQLKVHIWVGRVVLGLVFGQILWAFFGKMMVDWARWFKIHIVLSALILLSGWINIGIGMAIH
jgi:hypothetical protein